MTIKKRPTRATSGDVAGVALVIDVPYLPKYATTEEVCAALAGVLGGEWTLPRLLERGLAPWVNPGPCGSWPAGFMAQIKGAVELAQLRTRPEVLYVRRAQAPDGEFHDFVPPRALPVTALRWWRVDIEHTDWAPQGEQRPSADDATADDGRKARIEAMRKAGKKDTEIAKAEGISRQRVAQIAGSKQQNRVKAAQGKR